MKADLSLVVVCLATLAKHVHGFAVGGIGRTTQSTLTRSAHVSSRSQVLSRAAVPAGHGLSMAADGDGPMGYLKKFKAGWGESIPARDPGELPPSPSGINEKSKPVQALAFAAAVAVHVAGVKAGLKLLVELESKCNVFGSWKATATPVLGAFYALLGVLHFTMIKDMCNIVPGKGAWGVWYIPGRASFHVKWTGIVEFLAGAALIVGWLDMGPPGLLKKAAAVLFGLTVAVTPANIFMFTHGAQFPQGKKYPVITHVARAAIQCLLISVFWKLAMF